MGAVVGDGVRVAHLGPEGEGPVGGRFRVGHPARSYEEHHVHEGDDVQDRVDPEGVGSLAQLGQRSLGTDIADEEEVDGPPQHSHEREHGVAGRRGDGDDLLRERQSFVGERGAEDHVMQERQGFGHRPAVAGRPHLVHRRSDLVDRPGAGVHRLRGQPHAEPSAEIRAPVTDVGGGGAQHAMEGGDGIGITVLEDPDATQADGGLGAGFAVVLGRGGGDGPTERRPGVPQPPAGQLGLGQLEKQARRSGCTARLE